MTNLGAQFNYSQRDAQGKVAFYVLLWKREGISLELFDDYWRDVHGPVCARLPGQYQYWQFHLTQDQGGFYPPIWSRHSSRNAADNFDGIAELTFTSEAERQRWFEAAGILMDDERNLFRKAIGYTTKLGNSLTYVDGIAEGAPNGETSLVKFHVLVKKNPAVREEAFRRYLQETFAQKVSSHPSVLKFRLHLLEAVDSTRPDAAGVVHGEAPENQYQAAYEIAFLNHLEREKFFASPEYAAATREASYYLEEIRAFLERSAYTFVYAGQMTLAGQRSSSVAELITSIGAVNQLRDDIQALILKQDRNGAINPSTQKQQTGNGMKKRTNYYAGLSADYSRPGLVSAYVAQKLIEDAVKIVGMKEARLPEIGPSYTLEQIERENKEWWPTHCEALRQGRGDILTGEYRDDLIYLCQDGPYQGLEEQKEREKHWWALIAQPGVTMCWPIVMFSGEHTYFEWKCVDDATNETLAKGNVTWVRRGHRGACYLKTEQLTFYRDVFAPSELIKLITTA